MSAAKALFALKQQGALRAVDAAFAELLARLGGGEHVQLAGALALRAVELGHSGFALDQAAQLLDELDAKAALPDADAWTRALHESALVGANVAARTPLNFEHGRVSLRRYALYEADLAQRVAARANAEATTVAAAQSALLQTLFAPPRVESGAQAQPEAEPDAQALAAWLALRRKLLIVTGGPGTGKTTTVARILALLLQGEDAPRIALAAPTGRAAARLGEAIAHAVQRDVAAGKLAAAFAEEIPTQASTLHRLLGWRSGQVDFRHDADNPLPHDVVVVDEASMIDLPLMAKLVAAVREDAKLILLGDPDQLPAVEAGDVLGALCDAAGDGMQLPQALAEAASRELGAKVPAQAHAQPLDAARVHLQRAYRQAGAAQLAALTEAARRGDVQAATSLLHADDASVRWMHGNLAALEAHVEHGVLPAYAQLARAENPQAALRLASRQRVLTALRRGPFGADTWNRWFEQRLGRGERWFDARLVMVAANSYRHGLFNGDTGIAWRDERGEVAVWFEQGGALRAWRPGQLPPHESAFAGTVHKAQGSEFAHVLLLLPDRDYAGLNRELVYTGLSRAKSSLCLWSGEAAFAAALGRRTLRDSGLAARLR